MLQVSVESKQHGARKSVSYVFVNEMILKTVGEKRLTKYDFFRFNLSRLHVQPRQ